MNLARERIDPDADRVVRRLARRGFKAYLVGGCVRDLLLDRTPKDFDVATSATPNEIKQLFRNSRIIGRRFRLAHIFFGAKIIETSTFRANPREQADEDEELLIRRDNVFGSETDDAQRRDFTINGLFYDVEAETVIDHVGGMADLQARLIRTIGDPDIRFREDPVRMLRAVKFAARLGFTIEPATYAALLRHREELTKCAPPRVLEEFYRMLRGGAAAASLRLLIDTGVAAVLSPQLAALFGGAAEPAADAPPALPPAPPPPPAEDDRIDPPGDDERSEWAATWEDDEPVSDEEPAAVTAMVTTTPPDPDERLRQCDRAWRVLEQVDGFVARGGSASNALILAAIAHPFVIERLLEAGVKPLDASERIIAVMGPLASQLRVARRDAERCRQILLAQRRLMPERRRRGRPMNLVRRDYFDEALALYELAALAAGRSPGDMARWRELKNEGAPDSARPDEDGPVRKRRRRRRGGRRRRRNGAQPSTSLGDHGAAA